MPYDGGLESHEHLKQMAADGQRRAQLRMARRQLSSRDVSLPPPRRPWWAFWRRGERPRGTDAAETP